MSEINNDEDFSGPAVQSDEHKGFGRVCDVISDVSVSTFGFALYSIHLISALTAEYGSCHIHVVCCFPFTVFFLFNT